MKKELIVEMLTLAAKLKVESAEEKMKDKYFYVTWGTLSREYVKLTDVSEILEQVALQMLSEEGGD